MTETKKRGRPPVNKTAEVKIATTPEVTPTKQVKKQRALNELIDVKCIVHGGLYFINQQGLVIVWAEDGSVVQVEYKDLLYMSNTYRRFFEEPWVIMEQDVLEDLKVAHYYKDIINYDEIDAIFTKPPEKVKEILNKVPPGTKKLIADRATAALREGKLDSLKVVNVIQEVLQIDLI